MNGGLEGLPVGAIIPYAAPVNNPNSGSSFPDSSSKAYNLHLEQQGWLVCDGRPVALAQYPELFRAIGYIYGKLSDGLFLLPDYRGRFLRGVNDDAQGIDNLPRDPQADQRTASAPGGWSGDQVGSLQEDALESHEHLYKKAIVAGIAGEGSAVFGTDETPDPQTSAMVAPTGSNLSLRQAPETRVKNVYVNFIVKYTRAARPLSYLGDIGWPGEI
ncbi:MAG: phage tail protein [Burkholderiales bacterium]